MKNNNIDRNCIERLELLEYKLGMELTASAHYSYKFGDTYVTIIGEIHCNELLHDIVICSESFNTFGDIIGIEYSKDPIRSCGFVGFESFEIELPIIQGEIADKIRVFPIRVS